MANTQLTDLVVIGRGGTSYYTTVSDLKLSIFDGEQSANDGRYVLVGGDTMTGFLTLHSNPVDPFHAATKKYIDDIVGTDGGLIPEINGGDHQIGTLDDRYVEILGDTMQGALILHADPGVPMQATTKQYVDAGDEALATSIEVLDGKVDVEIQNRIDADTALDVKINDETARAEQAESDINARIDNLELDDLSDCSVAGATENQYLVYNGTNWVSQTITGVSDALQFQGSIDCTAEEAPSTPAVGWFYYNTGDGNALSSWTGLTTVIPGDRVVYGNDNQWHVLGNVNDGGNVTLDSLSIVTETAEGGGSLAYNNSNGVFTYKPADMDTRVPMDLSTLNVLPAPAP
jgi:hypothetical protein